METNELLERRKELAIKYLDWAKECRELCRDAMAEFIEKHKTNEVCFEDEEEDAPTSLYIDKYSNIKECVIRSVRLEDEQFTFSITIRDTGEEIEDAEEYDFYLNFEDDWQDLAYYIIDQIENGELRETKTKEEEL